MSKTGAYLIFRVYVLHLNFLRNQFLNLIVMVLIASSDYTKICAAKCAANPVLLHIYLHK